MSSKREQCIKRILVLDLDDTLYRNDHAMARQQTKNINTYCRDRLDLGEDQCYNLYKKYGTTINGLLSEGLIGEDDIDEFLEMAHTFSNEGRDLITPDKRLRRFLKRVTAEMFVFTAGTQKHAERCCRALGVSDLLFPDSRPIIDARICKLLTKQDSDAFEICLQEISRFLMLNVVPENLIFVDDQIKNVQCAKRNGWGICILMGTKDKYGELRTTEMEGVDYVVEHLSELQHIDELQDLFS